MKCLFGCRGDENGVYHAPKCEGAKTVSSKSKEQVEQIRQEAAANYGDSIRGWPTVQMKRHIDFLLSLLDSDSQAASIPYCVNCWHAVPHNGPAGAIDDACTHKGCNCGYYTPATSSDAAIAMRDKCVEKVKSVAQAHREIAEKLKGKAMGEMQLIRAEECDIIAASLGFLTLDQVEQERSEV